MSQQAFSKTQRLMGEVAIVTGADSGIGQAIAAAFAREGAQVAVTYYRDEEGIEDTRQLIETAGQKAVVYQLDQKDPKNVADLFDYVSRTLGLPSILVNNAAINMSGKVFDELSLEEWDLRIQTNLYGPFYCCKAFIEGLKQTGYKHHGSIINITSVHQEIPHVGGSDYDATKGGLRNLSMTLALEYADKNINVNNIAPGMVLTPMNQAALDDESIMAKQISPIPMKRAGEPWEIAQAAVFLASKDARYIQGSTLLIDGGLSLYHGQEALAQAEKPKTPQRSQRLDKLSGEFSAPPKTVSMSS